MKFNLTIRKVIMKPIRKAKKVKENLILLMISSSLTGSAISNKSSIIQV